MSGYAGKILEIDLSSAAVKVAPTMEIIGESQLRTFYGGRGLGSKLLWDRTEPGMDPLSEESPIFFLTGPLTALAPGSPHTCIVFKSPQTEITLGHPTIGGHWGSELKFAGYDGIIVTGKASAPCYLHVTDEKTYIKDARHLWGKGTRETEAALKKELGDQRASVLCIGPAGENGVRYAGIHSQHFHAAARGGGGCLMGSKGLKAIIVRGKRCISIKNPAEYLSVRKELENKLARTIKDTAFGYAVSRFGTLQSNVWQSDAGELSVKKSLKGD